MSELEISKESGTEKVESVEKLTELLKDIAERISSFIEHIQKGDLVEAIGEAGRAYKEVYTKFEEFSKPLAEAFEQVTGKKLDATLVRDLIEGIREIGKFVEHGIRGMLDIPREQWIPVARNLIIASVAFAMGDYVNGAIFTISAIQEFSKLKVEHPDPLRDYDVKEPVKQLRVGEQHKNQTQQILGD